MSHTGQVRTRIFLTRNEGLVAFLCAFSYIVLCAVPSGGATLRVSARTAKMRVLAFIGACLIMATVSAKGQNTLEYWVQKLDINLTGYGSGVPSTNGVVAGVKPTTVTLSSKELIGMLNNKPVFAISKGIT